MKTLLAAVFAALLALPASAQTTAPAATPKPEVPMVDARTNTTAKRTTTTYGEFTETSSTKRELSVHVELRSFHAPSTPYDVQCFFVSSPEGGGNQLRIYNVQRKSSALLAETFDFDSGQIQGKVSTATDYPITLTDTAGNTYDGDLMSGSTRSGQKFSGWIIRILNRGVVVKVVSNQQSLQDLAEHNPADFDKAIEKAK